MKSKFLVHFRQQHSIFSIAIPLRQTYELQNKIHILQLQNNYLMVTMVDGLATDTMLRTASDICRSSCATVSSSSHIFLTGKTLNVMRIFFIQAHNVRHNEGQLLPLPSLPCNTLLTSMTASNTQHKFWTSTNSLEKL